MILAATKTDKNVITFLCDVSNKESIENAGRIARQNFGTVTMLINNAGIVSGKTILENSDFMMKKTLEVNTLAHLYTIREFLPDMLKIKKGHIVSIASVAGTVGTPGLSDYCASKFGAFAIDECLRTEMKKHGHSYIKTTCICPFFINTGMFDGVKSYFPFKILDQHYVVWRILTAIRQEEELVIMPWMCNVIFLLRAFCPVSVADYIGKFVGGHTYMDTFRGRMGH
jgi:all-trans-retinol dehydrogenase (NAD+)